MISRRFGGGCRPGTSNGSHTEAWMLKSLFWIRVIDFNVYIRPVSNYIDLYPS